MAVWILPKHPQTINDIDVCFRVAAVAQPAVKLRAAVEMFQVLPIPWWLTGRAWRGSLGTSTEWVAPWAVAPPAKCRGAQQSLGTPQHTWTRATGGFHRVPMPTMNHTATYPMRCFSLCALIFVKELLQRHTHIHIQYRIFIYALKHTLYRKI